MAQPITPDVVTADTASGFPEPFRSRLGPFSGRSLGEHFDLDQFGVVLETLPAGSQSALRHWHSKSDEFVWMVAGELTLISNDGEAVLTPGMCVGFKANTADGHHLVNRSANDATFLVVGSRHADDGVTYSDDDFQWARSETGRYYAAHKDGEPYSTEG